MARSSISQATRDLIAGELRPPLGLLDLGAHHLRSIDGPPQRLYQVTGPSLLRDFPPPRTTEERRNNLKIEVTSFIGRDREIAQAISMLDRSALLTLTGPGGVGKTRIGLRLARQLLDQFDDGTWVVECGALTASALLLPSVVSTLGLTEPAGRSLLPMLVDHLADKQLLLVLDDCDPVLAAGGELAQAVLQSCSGVRMLVTSREALGVPGEAILPIASLATPDSAGTIGAATLGGVDACRLFVERARAVQPSFYLTDANAPAIAQLCAAGWTACRWRSSLRRRGSGPCRWSRSPRASMTASGC